MPMRLSWKDDRRVAFRACRAAFNRLAKRRFIWMVAVSFVSTKSNETKESLARAVQKRGIANERGDTHMTESLFQKIRSARTVGGRVSLLLLWLIGVPGPILVLIFLFRGCTGS